MHKLKPLQVKNAAIGKHADGGGLYFVKTNSGGKWIYRYTVIGKRREMGLGSYPEIGLADARRERDKWAEVLRQGKDPILEREKQKQEAIKELNKHDPSFQDLAKMVFETKKAGLKGKGVRGRWFSPIKVHLIPAFGKKPVSQITQIDIVAALKPLWENHPATATKAHQRLRHIFEKGKLAGYKIDPFTVDAAKELLGDLKWEVEHIKSTPWQEIPSLFQKLDQDRPTHRALRLLILTGVRSDSVLRARREEFDGDVWTIPPDRIKGREGRIKEFRVPLSDQAQEMLREWLAETDETYLFSSRKGKPISAQSIEKALTALEEEGRPHGFRSSFRTWVQETNAATYDVAETALGHVVGNKIERSYARSDLLDQRRVLMQRWADFVTGTEAKVVRLRG